MRLPKVQSKARILLVDDHAVLRGGMRHLIATEPDMEVVGEAEDGVAVAPLVEQLHPDVVVLDLSLPTMSGAAVIRQLKEIQAACKILVLTVQEDPAYLREALEAGALGYILKRAAADELMRALRAVLSGSVYIDSRLANKLISTLAPKPLTTALSGTPKLTERETQVLKAIAAGYAMKEIGAQLQLSVKTIETYKVRAMEKLGLSSRVEIVRIAQEMGWLEKLG